MANNETRLTEAQRNALALIREHGSIGLHQGVSRSTVRALEALGVVTVERHAPIVRYGVLGPAAGRYRGTRTANWTVRERESA
jgi:hypothetical protein